MILTGLVSLHLGQDLNWDLQNYHYYNGYAFLHGNIDQDFLAAGIQSYFNPFLDVMNYLMIAHFPAKLTGFLLGAIQGINFYLLWILASSFIKADASIYIPITPQDANFNIPLTHRARQVAQSQLDDRSVAGR